VFLKNYSVSLAEKIIPASELSEQISMAGLEASGTGNMKFALNGALTIGTMDGANIEIREEVGDENIFIFGLLADEIVKGRENGYKPFIFYESNSDLKLVIDMIASNHFNKSEPGLFKPIVDSLLGEDYYFLLADYQSYVDKQDEVSKAYKDVDGWTRKSIYNVARIGKFSSDRSVKEYAEKIWKVHPIKINKGS
jgi:starch phosphorylase